MTNYPWNVTILMQSVLMQITMRDETSSYVSWSRNVPLLKVDEIDGAVSSNQAQCCTCNERP